MAGDEAHGAGPGKGTLVAWWPFGKTPCDPAAAPVVTLPRAWARVTVKKLLNSCVEEGDIHERIARSTLHTPPPMNLTTPTLTKIVCLLAVVATLTAARPQALIGDIRMCAAEVEVLSCPTDNPVFDAVTTNIYISVDVEELHGGDRLRFTWYYLPQDEFFSDYLGSVTETVSAEQARGGEMKVTSAFPKGIDVKPGNYEVVVHPPDGSRPIIKTFKVLD